MSTSPSLSQLANAIDYLSNALWLSAESNYHQLKSIAAQEGIIVTAVQVEQEDLDKLTTDLTNVTGALEEEISALENAPAQQLPAGSLDGLKNAVAALKNLEPPTPTPAP